VVIRLETLKGKQHEKNRQLIWFVHYLSYTDEGLSGLAEMLLKKHRHRLGTRTMLKLAKHADSQFTADEMRQIRAELPAAERQSYPLKGEIRWDVHRVCWITDESRVRRLTRYVAENGGADHVDLEAMDRDSQKEREAAEKHPSSYDVSDLQMLCSLAADDGRPPYNSREKETFNLERELMEMCINPTWDLSAGGPWYFAALVDVLLEYQAEYILTRKDAFSSTSLSNKVFETLDFAAYSRRLTVMEGEARRGKSFAARSWCEQHPGQARFVEVPPTTDEISLLRAIARGLGLGNFLNYKAAELRARVESVLLTGNLALVLDEAHRLWPMRYQRFASPVRIEWIMSMANAGVPIALVSTPQFLQSQKIAEKSGWNSAQLIGRIFYVQLPADLSPEDLMAVAKFALPQADKSTLKAVAIYARSSATYVAAIETISTRAAWTARQDGRDAATTEDVRKAMQECVIPSDTKLKRVLAAGKKATIAAPDLDADDLDLPPSRTMPPAPAAPARRGNITEITPA
jgi:hypothetical protein